MAYNQKRNLKIKFLINYMKSSKNITKKCLKLAFIFLSLLLFLGIQSAFSQMQIMVPEREFNVFFRHVDENQVLTTVLDQKGDPVKGLGKVDFLIKDGRKTAQILSVEPLLLKKEIGLNIVMVVDNSFSMKERKAVQPLLNALDKFFSTLRPIDNVHLIVFDQKETSDFGEHNLHLRKFQSIDMRKLKNFLQKSFEENLSSKTYLYDAMFAGVHTIKGMPEKSNSFLVVFSDGEEINSFLGKSEIKSMAMETDLTAYAVDFMPKPFPDRFLKSFAEKNGGRLWKAANAEELLPIFESVSSTMFQHYMITYRFLTPPMGTVSLEPASLRIEEVTTIESSPLLDYVFFETDSDNIPDRYLLFPEALETTTFTEGDLKGTMEKYQNILNVIGQRLKDNPEASITLVGCNSNYGKERQAKELSRNRVDSITKYLHYIWGIDLMRISKKALNLPMVPSSSGSFEGRAENQRTEIHSDDPEILETVKSTYLEKICSADTIRITPKIESEAGIEKWTFYVKGDDGTMIEKISGKGAPQSYYDIEIKPENFDELAEFQNIIAGFEVVDNQGEVFKTDSAARINVEFMERKELVAQEMGYRIIEKFALILFDFDKAEIKGRNHKILDQIISRIKNLPQPRIKIEGHTDTIGKEEYNQKLSTRRAKAVHDKLIASGASGYDILYYGDGENNPIYNNELPEGRQLNRTVVVTLEYMKGQ